MNDSDEIVRKRVKNYSDCTDHQEQIVSYRIRVQVPYTFLQTQVTKEQCSAVAGVSDRTALPLYRHS